MDLEVLYPGMWLQISTHHSQLCGGAQIRDQPIKFYKNVKKHIISNHHSVLDGRKQVKNTCTRLYWKACQHTSYQCFF